MQARPQSFTATPSFALPGASPPAVAVPTELAAYHPAWPARFRVESEVLRAALAMLTPRFEHIGSTAVPGMPARPIIDVLLGLPDPAQLDAWAPRLANFGYRLGAGNPGGAPAGADRFLIRAVHGVRTHQVFVVEHFGDAWHRLLLFRDMLRIDTELASEYAALKQRHAQALVDDPQAYARAKAAFARRALGAETV